jgi:lysyl-tRNA synthetase class 2
MRRITEQKNARREKLERLRSNGIEPYPSTAYRSHTLAQVKEQFSDLVKQKAECCLVGRIEKIRMHGGSAFMTIRDEHASFQVYGKRDILGEREYSLWMQTLDIGDFLECKGRVFSTSRGEPTLELRSLRILAKALRPVPDAYYGVKDAETRLRKRYLDFLAHEDVRALFFQKCLFWNEVRSVLSSHTFLEVETPVFELVPGGADAKPFLTHYDALDEDRYLRISLELPLKRLLVGGFEKVFEIGRVFRNEGMSHEHLQEYTQMECYWAYADYRHMMKLVQEIFRRCAKILFQGTTITSNRVTCDIGKEWKQYDYFSLFQQHVGIDLQSASEQELRQKAERISGELPRYAGKGRCIDMLYKKYVRPTLQEIGFLLDPPVDVEPLAKRHANDPKKVQRFQVVGWGTELGKGFSELNDPIEQRERFAVQNDLRSKGDEEAQRTDQDFLEALEYGMPPSAGFGMSERVFAFFMNKTVRETTTFPYVRRLHNNDADDE